MAYIKNQCGLYKCVSFGPGPLLKQKIQLQRPRWRQSPKLVGAVATRGDASPRQSRDAGDGRAALATVAGASDGRRGAVARRIRHRADRHTFDHEPFQAGTLSVSSGVNISGPHEQELEPCGRQEN